MEETQFIRQFMLHMNMFTLPLLDVFCEWNNA